MKKLLALLLLLVPFVQADYTNNKAFLATAVACNASTTLVNGVGFTSLERTGFGSAALLTLTFARAVGSASLAVDFYFQVSYDGGTTWSDFHDAVSDAAYFSVLTGHAVVTGTTVRVSRTIILSGVSHIRLSQIVNNDTVNNLTACNATISW
jgi:hypothetical protein